MQLRVGHYQSNQRGPEDHRGKEIGTKGGAYWRLSSLAEYISSWWGGDIIEGRVKRGSWKELEFSQVVVDGSDSRSLNDRYGYARGMNVGRGEIAIFGVA